MAGKKVSDTLKQQRKANKDFLELKKMQSGEISPGLKPSEIEIKPKTFTEKLKNFWYHEKYVVIIATLLVALFVFLTVECVNKPEPDLKVIFFSYSYVFDESCKEIENYLQKYCSDINGDGKAVISVVNCSYEKNSSDFSYTNAQSTKLQAMMAADANALLFITDDLTYDYLQNLNKDSKLFEDEKLYLNEDFYKACETSEYGKLPEKLSISCRTVTNSTISKDKKIKKYYDASQKILDKLK